MLYRFLADAVLLLHLGFIVFAVAGGLMLLRWRRAIWAHVPAVTWGVLIQFAGWTCPLTPLENHLRHLGGQAGFSGGFIEHYLLSVLYPTGLTPQLQIALGAGLLALNAGLYGVLFLSGRPARTRATTPAERRA